MLLHQPGEGRSEFMELLLLHPSCFMRIAAEEVLDILTHSLIDEREEACRCGVKAVIEVEDPVADMSEAGVHERLRLALFSLSAN
jgi:hypothetical protein